MLTKKQINASKENPLPSNRDDLREYINDVTREWLENGNSILVLPPTRKTKL